MRTDAENRELLKNNGVAFQGEGKVVEVRFTAQWADWYCRTEDGQWYWWSGKRWKASFYGPTV